MNSSTSCNKLQKQGGKLLVLPAGGVVYVKLICQKKTDNPIPVDIPGGLVAGFSSWFDLVIPQ